MDFLQKYIFSSDNITDEEKLKEVTTALEKVSKEKNQILSKIAEINLKILPMMSKQLELQETIGLKVNFADEGTVYAYVNAEDCEMLREEGRQEVLTGEHKKSKIIARKFRK